MQMYFCVYKSAFWSCNQTLHIAILRCSATAPIPESKAISFLPEQACITIDITQLKAAKTAKIFSLSPKTELLFPVPSLVLY